MLAPSKDTKNENGSCYQLSVQKGIENEGVGASLTTNRRMQRHQDRRGWNTRPSYQCTTLCTTSPPLRLAKPINASPTTQQCLQRCVNSSNMQSIARISTGQFLHEKDLCAKLQGKLNSFRG